MSQLKQHKKRWLSFLSTNEWNSLFSDMAVHINSSSDVFQQLILQKARYHSCYEQEMLGEITKERAEVLYTNIRQGMFLLLKNLEDSTLGTGGDLVDPLDELISQLKLKQALTPLYLVNCDRRQNNRKFKRAFTNWESEKKKYQFYFALGCPSQEPESFAERMVFEIMSSKADDITESINYDRVIGSERLFIPELPLGLTLEDSKRAFRKYICDRFSLTTKSMEGFLEQELPNRKDKYIAFPFGIMASDWDPDLMEDYLGWIIDSFSNRIQRGPNCIFIFVVWLKNAHHLEKIRFEKEVIEHIEQLTTQKKELVKFLYPFNEVPRYYIEEWLEKAVEINQKDIDSVFSILENQLSEEEKQRYQTEDQLLDMERVEELQSKFWYLHQNN